MQTVSILEKSASAFELPPLNRGLYTTGLVLAGVTILYNLIEGIVSVYFGEGEESFALFGFGLDSFIEVLSGLGIAHMVLRIRRSAVTEHDAFERTALRITGTAFFLLTAGLVVSAAVTIYTDHRPVSTLAGAAVSTVSIGSMWLLLFLKRRTGSRLRSDAILADAECTRVCIYMSVVLLASSVLYMLFRLPYVDAAGCLGLAFFAFREGRECFEKAASASIACSCH